MQGALRDVAARAVQCATLTIGPWRVDLKAPTVQDGDGQTPHLIPTEFRLLEVVAEYVGLVVTHKTLLRQIRVLGRGWAAPNVFTVVF